MKTKHISVADAKARFAAVLDDVIHKGDRYVVERRGREVAAIVGIAELEQLADVPGGRPAGAMALVGLWHEVADDEIDALLADLRTARDQDTGRSVDVGE